MVLETQEGSLLQRVILVVRVAPQLMLLLVVEAALVVEVIMVITQVVVMVVLVFRFLQHSMIQHKHHHIQQIHLVGSVVVD